jgi:hypothetical protein
MREVCNGDREWLERFKEGGMIQLLAQSIRGRLTSPIPAFAVRGALCLSLRLLHVSLHACAIHKYKLGMLFDVG